jgi:hypothetical protein
MFSNHRHPAQPLQGTATTTITTTTNGSPQSSQLVYASPDASRIGQNVDTHNPHAGESARSNNNDRDLMPSQYKYVFLIAKFFSVCC